MPGQRTKRLSTVIIVYAMLILFTACGLYKDKEIKEHVEVTGRQDVAFTGVRYNVSKGVVTLSGTVPNLAYKSKVETAVGKLPGVKNVISNIQIAPVVITSDYPLQRGVDSIMSRYPKAEGVVKDSIVFIKGIVSQNEIKSIENKISELGPKEIQNQLQAASL